MSTDNATIELNLDRELRVLFEDRLTQLKSEGLYRSFMPCEHDASILARRAIGNARLRFGAAMTISG